MQRFLAVFGLLVYLPLLGYLWTAGRIKRQRVAGRLRQEDLSGTLSFTTLTIHVWKGRRGLAKYIPALWDVARGKLHLVGSEPLKPAAAHPLLQSWEQPRFSRLPGLVNPWHATSNPYPYEFEKRATEVYYAKTRTPAQDFKILLSSLPSLWKKEPTREEQRDY